MEIDLPNGAKAKNTYWQDAKTFSIKRQGVILAEVTWKEFLHDSVSQNTDE